MRTLANVFRYIMFFMYFVGGMILTLILMFVLFIPAFVTFRGFVRAGDADVEPPAL